MAKRGWHYDYFEHLTRPLWIIAEDRYGKIHEHSEVADDVDPKCAFVNALALWANRGWTLETFNSQSITFYCHRDGERRLVSLTTHDPRKPRPWKSHTA